MHDASRNACPLCCGRLWRRRFVVAARRQALAEEAIADEARQNELCTTGSLHDQVGDYPQAELANLRNQLVWSSEPELRRWMRDSRLDGFGKVVKAVTPDESEKMAVLLELRDQAWPAATNLERLARSATGQLSASTAS